MHCVVGNLVCRSPCQTHLRLATGIFSHAPGLARKLLLDVDRS